jgi:hypothetical protein
MLFQQQPDRAEYFLRDDTMPCSYRIDKKRRLVIGVGTGTVTKEDIILYLRNMKNDAAFDPHYDKIENTRDVTELKINNADLQEISQIIILDNSVRRALVASRDLLFGVSRMFEAYRGSEQEGNFGVFRTKDEALQWINNGRLERQLEPIPLSLELFHDVFTEGEH